MLGKIVAGVIGGFIVSFFAGNVITLVGGSKGGAAAVGLIVWGVAIVAALKSPSGCAGDLQRRGRDTGQRGHPTHKSSGRKICAAY